MDANDINAEIDRRALEGHLVLPVADAEQLYAEYGDAAAFEALAAAVNAEANDDQPKEG